MLLLASKGEILAKLWFARALENADDRSSRPMMISTMKSIGGRSSSDVPVVFFFFSFFLVLSTLITSFFEVSLQS